MIGLECPHHPELGLWRPRKNQTGSSSIGETKAFYAQTALMSVVDQSHDRDYLHAAKE